MQSPFETPLTHAHLILVLVIVIRVGSENIRSRAGARLRRSKSGPREDEMLRGGSRGRWSDQGFVQARFPAVGRILMDNAPLGCLIDGGDHCLHVLRLRFRPWARNAFLHLAQASKDASIAERAHRRLAGALGGGFCISHWETRKFVSGEARGEGATCQDTMRSFAAPLRVECASTTRRGQSEAARRSRPSCRRSTQALSLELPARLPFRVLAWAPRA